jgi:FAD/FMN-containing dehydrogenase
MPESMIGFLHLGGALEERDDDDGAVGNRRTRYALGVIGHWEPDDPAGGSYPDWVRAAGDRIRPFSSGTYVNFQTEDEGEQRVQAAYGANFDRLRQVKRRHDPGNVFRSNRNVKP